MIDLTKKPILVSPTEVRPRDVHPLTVGGGFGGGEKPKPGPVEGLFYFQAKEAGSTVSMKSDNTVLNVRPLQYSFDGTTWQEWPHTTIAYMQGGTFETITLANIGDIVYFKNDSESAQYQDNISANYCYWILSGNLKMGGDMRSLVGGSNTPRQMPSTYYTSAACITEVDENLLTGFTSTSFSCFNGLLSNTAITKAPKLPWSTVAEKAFHSMFYECSNLVEVECLATDISASNCTAYWLYGVAENGTFTKAASMTNWTEGENGIPSGWTVINHE